MGVRGRLLMAFLGICMFSLIAAAAGFYSLSQVGGALNQITEKRVPEALAWLQMSRRVEGIVRSAPALLVAKTERERSEASSEITSQTKRLNLFLQNGSNYETEEERVVIELVTSMVEEVNNNLVDLDNLVKKRLIFVAQRDALVGKLARASSVAKRTLAPGSRVLDSQIAGWHRSNASSGSAVQKSAKQNELAGSIINLIQQKKAAVLIDELHNNLLDITTAQTPESVDILLFPNRTIQRDLFGLVSKFPERIRKRMVLQLAVFGDLAVGPENLPNVRKNQLEVVARAEEVLEANVRQSKFLTNKIDFLVERANSEIAKANIQALKIQTLNRQVLIAVVSLSLLSSLLIVWLYVGRNLIARLSALSNSMLAISEGDLHTPLPPTKGRDEISLMARALVGFRDTAIEIKESNLREIATARQRLVDAIESINEGFAFYDAEDRLVLSNQRYKDLLYDQIDVDLTPGTTFEDILRNAVANGLIEEARDNPEDWLQRRLEQHKNPGQPVLQKRAANRWIMVSERKVDGGGTVALYSDLTTIKEYERELENSQQRFRDLFENAPVAMFEEDWSGIEREIRRLKDDGVEDLQLYFEEHPEVIDRFADLVVWKDFNPAAIILYRAKDNESLRAHLIDTEDTYSWDVYAQAALAFLRGKTKFSREVTEYTVDGQEITIIFTCQLGENSSDWSSITTTSQDITKLTQREQQLSQANQQIMSSVHYASRIQEAMLPSRKALSAIVPDHFLIWEPRDIVGGDFFWCHQTLQGSYIIVGDCTGHGVPGAFMTLIACGLIDRYLRTNKQITPGELLSAMHSDLQLLLGQDEKNTATDDGLEAGVCFIDAQNKRMTFAGSRFSLFALAHEQVIEIKGDKSGIGHNRYNSASLFRETELSVEPGHRYFLATDGLFDQIGGPKRRGFGKARLHEFIKSHKKTKVIEQGDALRAAFLAYQGNEHRRDDLTVLGFEVSSK